jgi:hypothetical protein
MISHELIRTFSSLIKEKQHVYESKLAGSLAEGVFSPRFFGEERKKFELDVEFIALQIGPQHNSCVNEIPGKQGFAQISMHGRCANLTSENRRKPFRAVHPEKERILLSDNGFILTHELKKFMLYDKVFLSGEIKYYHRMIKGIKLWFSYALNEPFSALKISNLYRRITKSTCEAGLDLEYRNSIVSLSADVSIIIKLEWKPRALIRWEKRDRKWPLNMKEVLENQESYLIGKTSVAEKKNNKTTEFRYSFAHLERKLITLQSHTQRLVYLLFKSIIYKWILPLDTGDHLSSYAGKTIMLWTCEQNPPDNHTFWSNTPAGIKRTVVYLLSELSRCCRKRFMQYFFISEINVLENVGIDILDAVADKIDDVMKRFEEHIGALMEDSYKLESILQKARNRIVLTRQHLQSFFSNDSSYLNLNVFKLQLDMLFHFGFEKIKDISNFREVFSTVTDHTEWENDAGELFDLYFYSLSPNI